MFLVITETVFKVNKTLKKRMDSYWIEHHRWVYTKTKWNIKGLVLVYIKVRWSRGKYGTVMKPQSQPYLITQGVRSWSDPLELSCIGPKCSWDIDIPRVQRWITRLSWLGAKIFVASILWVVSSRCTFYMIICPLHVATLSSFLSLSTIRAIC